jgi:hypothetical protein
MQRTHSIASLAAAILLAACSGASGAAGESPTTSADTASAPAAEITSAPSDVPSQSAAPTLVDQLTQVDEATTAPTDAAPTDLVLAPGQRSEPIGVDAGFHNDEARVVAASGRPQFIEMFTFW